MVFTNLLSRIQSNDAYMSLFVHCTFDIMEEQAFVEIIYWGTHYVLKY